MLLSTLVALPVPGGAWLCTPTASTPEIRAGPLAIFQDIGSDGVPDLFVYHESNRVNGIQRNDEGRRDVHCGDGPDDLLFAMPACLPEPWVDAEPLNFGLEPCR